MPRLRPSAQFAALLTTLAFVAVAAPVTGSASAAPVAAHAGAASSLHPHSDVSVKAPAQKKRSSSYHVRAGVVFNSPLGSSAKGRVIITKINSAIRHAKKGSEIKIFSWKIWTRAGVTALLAAQKRGVVVHALMDKSNVQAQRNPHFWRLRRGLAAGNKKLPKKQRSGARLCDHSCRGKGGAAHAKYMLFSKVGKSKDVLMMSSANWGDPAAKLQWNDLYTFVGRGHIYKAARRVFAEAWKDRKAKHTWAEYATPSGSTVVAWGPTTSKSRKSDRLVSTLRKVKCTGATGGAGNARGHTIIRYAPDVIRNDRGLMIAKILRKLWRAGCDVKIGYTVMGRDIAKVLKAGSARGPVPIRHLVQDFDGDGIFDRYFHLKVMTVNGVIGKNTKGYWMLAGSANTSQLAQYSDENYTYFIGRRGITRKYQNHVDFWITHFPASSYRSALVARRVALGDIDPYAHMELD